MITVQYYIEKYIQLIPGCPYRNGKHSSKRTICAKSQIGDNLIYHFRNGMLKIRFRLCYRKYITHTFSNQKMACSGYALVHEGLLIPLSTSRLQKLSECRCLQTIPLVGLCDINNTGLQHPHLLKFAGYITKR